MIGLIDLDGLNQFIEVLQSFLFLVVSIELIESAVGKNILKKIADGHAFRQGSCCVDKFNELMHRFLAE